MEYKEQKETKIFPKSVSFGKNFLYEVDDSHKDVAVIESIKEKHARIADMFLARPAPEEVRLDFERYYLQMSKRKEKKKKPKKEKKNGDRRKVKNTDEKMKEKIRGEKKNKTKTKDKKKEKKKENGKEENRKDGKKEKGKKRTEKEHEVMKMQNAVSQVEATSFIEEEKEVTSVGRTKGRSKNPLIALYSRVRNWFAKKKKKHEDKREAKLIKCQEKKEEEMWAEIKEAPNAYYLDDVKNDGDMGACDVDIDVYIVDIDNFF